MTQKTAWSIKTTKESNKDVARRGDVELLLIFHQHEKPPRWGVWEKRKSPGTTRAIYAFRELFYGGFKALEERIRNY